jgi:beta-lactamase regulating signal transducer with metallopeptidase domain/TolA-binding protein
MIPNIEVWLAEAPWMRLLVLFIDVTLKGAMICAVAGIATLLLRRSSAFVRNMVWVFALVGLVLLPVFSLLSPLWNVPIIPHLASWGVESYTPQFEKPDPAAFVGPPNPAGIDARQTASLSDDPAPSSIPWYAWVLLTWIVGGFFYLCWWLASHASIRAIVKQAHPAKKEWALLLDGVAEELDLRRKVRLLESGRLKAAITAGIFDPAIVLPSDTSDWTANRRRLVLSHELAHVKRWDTLIEAFALLVTVIYWFNPLVWFAVKQLRIERETDCDNAVLRAGAKPSDYAELLMNIAADLGDSARPVWQLSTISQSSNLKDRLMSILNAKINRNSGSRRTAVLTGVLVLALVLPISASGLWSQQTEEKAKEQEKQKQQTEDVEKKKKEKKSEKDATHAKKKKMTSKEAMAKKWEKMCADETSAACHVGKVIKKKGTEAGIKAYYDLKKAEDGKYRFEEKEFNSLGYVFLYHGKTEEAIAVFELNVKEYPESWNVYDSLGEGYMVAGRYDEAVKYYETALKMNPESKSSKKALDKLASLQNTSS